MCWRSSSDTNQGLIANMVSNGLIKSNQVKIAMLEVDRKYYTTICSSSSKQNRTTNIHHDTDDNHENKINNDKDYLGDNTTSINNPNNAYTDQPQYLGFGATISAPHMHAICLELLKPILCQSSKKMIHALDIGSGSGYLVSCMARMIYNQMDIKPTTSTGTRVYGIEHIPQLAKQSILNIQKDQPLLYTELNFIKIIIGDGYKGLPHLNHGFDVIHIGAAAPTLSQSLLDQLNPGGRMVIPIGQEMNTQVLTQIDKHSDGSIQKQTLMGVAYVPLCSKEYQLSRYAF